MSVNFENKENPVRGIVGIPKESISTKGIRNLADFEAPISFGINMWPFGDLHHSCLPLHVHVNHKLDEN
jgi:hypothetical protein